MRINSFATACNKRFLQLTIYFFLFFFAPCEYCLSESGDSWGPTNSAPVQVYESAKVGEFYLVELVQDQNPFYPWVANVFCEGTLQGTLRNAGDWISCAEEESVNITGPVFSHVGSLPKGMLFSIKPGGPRGDPDPRGPKGLQGPIAHTGDPAKDASQVAWLSSPVSSAIGTLVGSVVTCYCLLRTTNSMWMFILEGE